MEPWFNGSQIILDRAITNANIHFCFYLGVIITEIIIGLLYLNSSFMFFISIRNKKRLELSKSIFLIASVIALLLWYFGFAVIGGEYFSMWGNKFNGQDKAYTFSIFILLSMIYIKFRE